MQIRITSVFISSIIPWFKGPSSLVHGHRRHHQIGERRRKLGNEQLPISTWALAHQQQP